MRWRVRAAVVLAVLALGGCFHRHATRPSTPATRPSTPRESGGRYAQDHDSTPTQIPDISKVPEPVPRDEPRSVYGNKSPYTVLGETYHVLPTCKGYDERGLASWYGNKFNGYTTSNFEKYDMYAYSAASKVLPLPCYVRVTNLQNGRSAIVRVNDRGPFVANRIIDLSFVAAIKLGVYPGGTAMVEVRGIDPDHPQRSAEPARGGAVPTAPGKTPKPLLYLQVGAFADPANAERAAAKVRSARLGAVALVVVQIGGKTLRRVRLGPLRDAAEADALAPKLRALGLGEVRVSIDN
ncbi:MAG TPA: septal ring lytic transglycosylase RlpA family protein [Rudaea sp.]|nr:septal ring lytic transglycosylase RlpA family protein [Rudaea sp.]